MNEKKILGKWGEDKAVWFLKKNGFKILERNYKTNFGEIDIVAQKKKEIFFIEVKTRKREEYNGLLSIDSKKLKKLEKLAEFYIKNKRIKMGKGYSFAVISIIGENVQIIYI